MTIKRLLFLVLLLMSCLSEALGWLPVWSGSRGLDSVFRELSLSSPFSLPVSTNMIYFTVSFCFSVCVRS